MDLIGTISTTIKCPQVLKGYNNIYLLSHMRANTSLFGHILGSNPDVQGYYEMHIGYYSWKSRVRQKLLYFAEHQAKANARYMFDKVLHSEHFVAPALLRRDDAKVIFMLREAEQTLPSIIKLYQRVDPSHHFCTPEGAAQYYIERVNTLGQIAEDLDGRFLYLDANSLKEDTDRALQSLTTYLTLSTPLTEKYDMFEKTASGASGDSSENMKAGTIVRSKSQYDLTPFSPDLLAEAKSVYGRTRTLLLSKAANGG